ncbi:MAG: tRNA (5-methylaminomethyl-2-thiouridine)(34)-methyltransferase MnmD [Chitinophagales bacterium]
METLEIFKTEDGSDSIRIKDQKITYHSIYGAITESMHIFIQAGLIPFFENGSGPIRIFEMGFGTGLNALLTMIAAEAHSREIIYHAIDTFPLQPMILSKLNYPEQLNSTGIVVKFQKINDSVWNKETTITPYFRLLKWEGDLLEFTTKEKYHLVYFDPFAPEVQPDLWSLETFVKISRWLEVGGILLTYSSKGEIRRALERAGFAVEKLKGPPGKREITRATKKINTAASDQ